ncbi:MAG: TonB-dependent receptor [Gammaproteobacteria bacterium]|nr:TonB-dependent receptor [Gammaproteobacteria bacterium]
MIRRPFSLVLLCASLLLCPNAPAGPAEAESAPAAEVPLDEALFSFAEATGLQLVYQPELVAGKTARAYAPSAGAADDPGAELARLLRGTKLSYTFVNDRTVAIESSTPKDGPPDKEDTDPGGAPEPSDGQPAASESDSPGAQSAPGNVDDGPPEREVEEVIVTGSRIQRARSEVTAPLTVIDGDYLRDRGYADVGQALLAEASSTSSNLATTNTANPTLGGISSVNLRGFTRGSSSRTLVLVNGRRQAAGIVGSSDVNLANIPTSRVERIEIITGASSAVYGTDAIAGVVNIILKDRHDGIDYTFRLQGNEHGDGDEQFASVTWGKSFDNGGLMLNLEHTNVEPALRENRDFLDPLNLERLIFSFDFTTLSLTTELRDNVTNPAINGRGLFRHLFLTFDDAAGLVPFDPGELTISGQSIGGDGPPAEEERTPYLTFPVERTQLGITFDRTLGSADGIPLDVEAFGEATYIRTHSGHRGFYVDLNPNQETTLGPVLVDPGNPFLPPTSAAILSVIPAAARAFTRRFYEFGRNTLDTESNQVDVVLGLKGTMPNDFRWEVSYSADRSERYLAYDSINRWRLKQAVEATRDPATGEPVCADPSAGCVPIDPFGPFDRHTLPPALIDFLYFSPEQQETTRLQVASASLLGRLLPTPAGDMRFALNLEYRRQSVGIDVNQDTLIEDTFAHSLGNYDYSKADFSVGEARAELNIPLLAGQPLVNKLSLDLSGSIGNYSHIDGAVDSWKAGLAWAPIGSLRFRIALGSAIRAPNLGEVSGPGSEQIALTLDRCSLLGISFAFDPDLVRSNCEARGVNVVTNSPFALASLVTRRNPDLGPETAQTLTAGFTFEPPFVPGLVLEADYFDIDTDRVIRFLQGTAAHFDCVTDQVGDGSSPACDFVVRNPDGTIDTILSQYDNLDRLASRGLDLNLSYSLALAGGELDLSFTGTRLELFRLTPYHGVVRDEIGWPGTPRKKYRISANYFRGPVGLFLSSRFQDTLDSSFGGRLEGIPRAESVVYHDATARWTIAERFELRLGATNLLDTRPKSSVQLNILLYDLIGRRVFLSLGGSL